MAKNSCFIVWVWRIREKLSGFVSSFFGLHNIAANPLNLHRLPRMTGYIYIDIYVCACGNWNDSLEIVDILWCAEIQFHSIWYGHIHWVCSLIGGEILGFFDWFALQMNVCTVRRVYVCMFCVVHSGNHSCNHIVRSRIYQLCDFLESEHPNSSSNRTAFNPILQ